MSTLEIGGICLAVGTVLFFLKWLPTVQVILGFVGTCIVTSGLFGHAMSRVAVWFSNLTDSLAGRVFGVGIPGLLVIILGIVFVHDLMPKHETKRRTLFVGVALAACLVAGVSNFQALNNIPGSVRTGATNASTIG